MPKKSPTRPLFQPFALPVSGPRFYSTSESTRLETRARKMGLRLGILYAEGDKCDRYFIVSMAGTRLERPHPLGWTGQEAESELARIAQEGL